MFKSLSIHTQDRLEELLSNVGDMSLKRRARKIIEGINPKKGEKIIDLGCGTGYYLFLISNLGMKVNLTGFDYDDKAIKEGADFIATGHYVELRKESVTRRDSRSEGAWFPEGESERRKSARELAGRTSGSLGTDSFRLFVAKDKNKDQSYFLWTLKQEQLKHCLFPVGEYTKPEVRKMAKKFGLANHDKKDSQGVCFIGPLDMKDFLKTKIKSKKGKVLSLDGRVLGTHDGVYYYTIGQRHGLNLSIGGGPYYVVSKDIKKNIIYVGGEKELLTKKTKVLEISWINGGLKLPAEIDVRLRYRAGLKKAILKNNGELVLKTPERAITSGQSAVFYRKGELLGGGIIT